MLSRFPKPWVVKQKRRRRRKGRRRKGRRRRRRRRGRRKRRRRGRGCRRWGNLVDTNAKLEARESVSSQDSVSRQEIFVSEISLLLQIV